MLKGARRILFVEADRPFTAWSRLVNMNDLIKKLNRQQSHGADDVARRRDDWLKAVDALLGRLENWVAPAVKAGALQTHRVANETRDDDLGAYVAPTLYISDRGSGNGGHAVRVEPTGPGVAGLVVAGRRLAGL